MDGLLSRSLCDAIQGVLHVKKIVILPIIFENRSWGSLVLFLEEEVALDILEMVQMHCTLGLKKVIAQQSLEIRNQELAAINTIAAYTFRSLEMEKIIENTLVETKRIFDADRAAVYLIDESTSRLKLAGQSGSSSILCPDSLDSTGLDTLGSFFSSEQRVLACALNDISSGFGELSGLPVEENPAWFMMSILTIDSRRAGLIVVVRLNKPFFTKSEQDLLISVGNQLSIACNNAHLHRNLLSRVKELEATQTRLTDSEQKMNLTVDTLFDGVMVLSLDGKIIQSNEAAARLHGYHRDEEFIGKNGLRYVVWEDRRKMMEILKYVLETGANHISEYTVVRKDGSRFISEMNIGLNKNFLGQPLGYIFSIRDVSQKKQAETSLLNSERKFRLIAENTNELISMVNLNGYYTYLNPTHKLFGLEPDTLLNTSVMDIVHPDDRTRLMPTLLKFSQMEDDDLARLRKQNYNQRLEYRIKDQSGHWRDFEVTGTIVEALDGIGYNLLFISRDISLRKKAETQLNLAYQKEKEVHTDLEQEINRRAEFFRALVHELKTPLTPILISSETLVELLDKPAFKNLARNVYNGATRLNNRVDELLDIARGELGILKVIKEPLNMVVLIQETASFILPMVQQNKLNLTVELPENLPLIMGDQTRLRQVLFNLLENAIKFTPEGGKIGIKALTDDQNLLIVIQDNGRGIDKEDQERIFQPYNRIEDDRQHFSGLGLGLALSKQLVELHGGRIKIASKKGEGTTFYISLAVPEASELEKVSNSSVQHQ
jgi:PAS domain S-box-containing protein